MGLNHFSEVFHPRKVQNAANEQGSRRLAGVYSETLGGSPSKGRGAAAGTEADLFLACKLQMQRERSAKIKLKIKKNLF